MFPSPPNINRNDCNKDRVKYHYIDIDKFVLGNNTVHSISGLPTRLLNEINISLVNIPYYNIKQTP